MSSDSERRNSERRKSQLPCKGDDRRRSERRSADNRGGLERQPNEPAEERDV